MITLLDKKVLSDASNRRNKAVIKNSLYVILVLWENQCFRRIVICRNTGRQRMRLKSIMIWS